MSAHELPPPVDRRGRGRLANPIHLAHLVQRVVAVPGRAIRALLLGMLWVYRNTVSPLLGPRCRYYPSCSQYAVQALQTHGAAKGTALAVARVCRCHPWAAGGVDRVPRKGRWRPDPEPPSEFASLSSGPTGADADAGPVHAGPVHAGRVRPDPIRREHAGTTGVPAVALTAVPAPEPNA